MCGTLVMISRYSRRSYIPERKYCTYISKLASKCDLDLDIRTYVLYTIPYQYMANICGTLLLKSLSARTGYFDLDRHIDRRTHGQFENYMPPKKKFSGSVTLITYNCHKTVALHIDKVWNLRWTCSRQMKVSTFIEDHHLQTYIGMHTLLILQYSYSFKFYASIEIYAEEIYSESDVLYRIWGLCIVRITCVYTDYVWIEPQWPSCYVRGLAIAMSDILLDWRVTRVTPPIWITRESPYRI